MSAPTRSASTNRASDLQYLVHHQLITHTVNEKDDHTMTCTWVGCGASIVRPGRGSGGRIGDHVIFNHSQDSRVKRLDEARKARTTARALTKQLATAVCSGGDLTASPTPSTSGGSTVPLSDESSSRTTLPGVNSLEQYRKSAAVFLATAGLPFSTVENPFFRHMITAASPSPPYTLWAGSVKAETKVQADIVRQVIVNRLQCSNKYVTLALDGWTNVVQDKVTNIVLLCGGVAYYWKSITNKYAADTSIWIFNELKAVLDELRQLHISVVALVTDNAASMVNLRLWMQRDYHLLSVPCAAHTIQLVVRDIMDLPAISCYTTVFDKVLDAFKSKEQRLKLKQYTPYKLVSANDTRWNSQLLAYERMAAVSDSMRLVAKLPSATVHMQMTDDQWAALTDLVHFLQPFRDATNVVQRDDATLMDVFRAFAQCLSANHTQYSTPELNSHTLQKHCVSIVHERYFKLINNAAVRVALKLSFQWESAHRNWKSLINVGSINVDEENELYAVSARMASAISVVSGSDSAASSSSSQLAETTCRVTYATSASTSVRTRIAMQLAQFKQMNAAFECCVGEEVGSKHGVINYWLSRVDSVETADLARAALALLSINPSEASVERTFSQQKLIQSKLRNRLSDELIEQQMMLRCNYSTVSGARMTKRKRQSVSDDDVDDDGGDDDEL